MPQHPPSAIIIGAGPNGLCAGIRLAQAGWSVRVIEAQPHIGGGVRSASLTHPDFTHDICASVFPLAAGSPFLQTLPLHQLGLQWIHPPACMAHPFDDHPAVTITRNVTASAAHLENKKDRRAYERLFTPLAAHFDDLAEEVLAPPLHLPRHPLTLMRFARHAIQSAQSAGARLFTSDQARGWWAGVAAHGNMPLNRRPSAAFALLLTAAAHGVGWPIIRGGAQRLTDALTTCLTQLGGEIITNHRVKSMDDLPPADAYLFNLPPRHFIAIAQNHLPGRYQRQLTRFRHGPGVFKIYWALSEPIPWRDPQCRQTATVHLGGMSEEISASEAAVARNEHPTKPYALLTQPGLFDPSRAPAGNQTAAAYCHVPAYSTVDMTAAIEAQVERFAPGFRQCILVRKTMNTHQFEQHNAALIGGDIAGGVTDLWQMIARPTLRLVPYATPNPRLWLCSSSTPPGAGVHGLCGYHAAEAILRRHHNRPT